MNKKNNIFVKVSDDEIVEAVNNNDFKDLDIPSANKGFVGARESASLEINRRLKEEIVKLKNSTDRFNSIMIFLTVILVILTALLFYKAFQ